MPGVDPVLEILNGGAIASSGRVYGGMIVAVRVISTDTSRSLIRRINRVCVSHSVGMIGVVTPGIDSTVIMVYRVAMGLRAFGLQSTGSATTPQKPCSTIKIR